MTVSGNSDRMTPIESPFQNEYVVPFLLSSNSTVTNDGANKEETISVNDLSSIGTFYLCFNSGDRKSVSVSLDICEYENLQSFRNKIDLLSINFHEEERGKLYIRNLFENNEYEILEIGDKDGALYFRRKKIIALKTCKNLTNYLCQETIQAIQEVWTTSCSFSENNEVFGSVYYRNLLKRFLMNFVRTPFSFKGMLKNQWRMLINFYCLIRMNYMERNLYINCHGWSPHKFFEMEKLSNRLEKEGRIRMHGSDGV